VSYTLLTLHLVLLSGLPHPSGTVTLVNEGSADVRLWRTGNEWGDTVLSFEVSRGSDIWRVVRRPQIYTRNVPSSVVVPAGATHEWPFDLGDGEWDADTQIDQLIATGAQLVARYDVPLSPEAAEHGVWTGQLQSQPVLLDVSNPGLSKPD
jgi:hypothetical protein